MNCYICEKQLNILNEWGYVCICDKCLEIMEKTEARMVEKISEQREALKKISETNKGDTYAY